MNLSRRKKSGGKNGTKTHLVAPRSGTRMNLVADGRNGTMEGLSKNGIKEGNFATMRRDAIVP